MAKKNRSSTILKLFIIIVIKQTVADSISDKYNQGNFVHKSDLLRNFSSRFVPEFLSTMAPLPTIASPEELRELHKDNADAPSTEECRTDICWSDPTDDLKGDFMWNTTTAGSYAYLPCPNGVWPFYHPSSMAYRPCIPPPQGFLIRRMPFSLNSTWGAAVTDMCRWHSNITLVLEELQDSLESSLQTMNRREVGNTTEVIVYLKTVESLIRNETLLTEEDVKVTAAIVELVQSYGMAEVFDLMPSVGDLLVFIASNILDIPLDILHKSQDATLSLANSLEKYTEAVIFPQNSEKIEHYSANLMIELNQPKGSGWFNLPRQFSFSSSACGDGDSEGTTVLTIEVTDWEPKSFKFYGDTDRMNTKSSSGSTVVRSAVIVYYTTKFFIPVTGDVTPVSDNVMVYVHAFADDKAVDSLTEPIYVTFHHLVENHDLYERPSFQCAAGDITPLNVTISDLEFTPVSLSWSEAECHLNYTNATFTRCLCHDLDLISLIEELIPPTKKPTEAPSGSFDWLGFPYTKGIAIVSYIGYILSTISLILTIMTYAIYRNLRRGRPTLILVNLSVSVLLLLLVLVISSTMTSGIRGCRVANFLRSYFILVSMMWNGVEAVNLYLALVKVFTQYTSHFVLRSGIIAWGLPLFIVSTPFLLSMECYDGTYSNCAFTCTLRRKTFYWVFVFPMALIVIFNATVFGLVLKVIKDKAQHDSMYQVVNQLRGAVALFVLLGLTWVFGAAAIINYNSVNTPLQVTQIVCQALFVIGLTFQGFFIFVFHCARYKDVREQWKISLSCLNVKNHLRKRRHNRQKRKSSDSQASTSDLVSSATMQFTMMDTSL
ncbi:uncharacterized protein [Antedon mediterranea]|uniref:uncharacterized protein n=1 Tax=Antedon mediterranea TaxID=105859 RepID=UPI003AF5CE77